MAEIERVLHELALTRRSTPERLSPANEAPKAPSLIPAPSPIDRLVLDPGLDFVFHKDGMIELTEAGFRRMGQAHSAGLDTIIEVDRRYLLYLPPREAKPGMMRSLELRIGSAPSADPTAQKSRLHICSDRSEDAGRAACHRRRSRDHMGVRACVPKSHARLATPRATSTRRPRRRRQLAHGALRLVGFQWWRQSTTQRLNRGCQRNPPRQTTGAGATTTGAAGATTTGAAGATTTGPSLGRHLP